MKKLLTLGLLSTGFVALTACAKGTPIEAEKEVIEVAIREYTTKENELVGFGEAKTTPVQVGLEFKESYLSTKELAAKADAAKTAAYKAEIKAALDSVNFAARFETTLEDGIIELKVSSSKFSYIVVENGLAAVYSNDFTKAANIGEAFMLNVNNKFYQSVFAKTQAVNSIELAAGTDVVAYVIALLA